MFLLLLVASAVAENIFLEPGQIHKLVLEDEKLEEKIIYNFTVESWRRIRVYCDDFRLPYNGVDNDCDLSEVIFDDGSNVMKMCGSKIPQPINIISNGPDISMELNLKNGGFIDCIFKPNEFPDGEKIFLEQEKVVIDTANEDMKPYFDKAWYFTSPPGTNITVRCSLSVQRYTPCYQNTVFLDMGDGIVEHCGNEDLIKTSSSENVALRFQLDKFANKNIKCAIRANTGKYNNELEIVSSEKTDEENTGNENNANEETDEPISNGENDGVNPSKSNEENGNSSSKEHNKRPSKGSKEHGHKRPLKSSEEHHGKGSSEEHKWHKKPSKHGHKKPSKHGHNKPWKSSKEHHQKRSSEEHKWHKKH